MATRPKEKDLDRRNKDKSRQSSRKPANPPVQKSKVQVSTHLPELPQNTDGRGDWENLSQSKQAKEGLPTGSNATLPQNTDGRGNWENLSQSTQAKEGLPTGLNATSSDAVGENKIVDLLKKDIEGSFWNLSSPWSDISFKFNSTVIPGREGVDSKVCLLIYADMKSERYNVPPGDFLACPVVALSGIQRGNSGTITLEHALNDTSALKVLRSRNNNRELFNWETLDRQMCQIDKYFIHVHTEDDSAYTCTLQNGPDYTNLSLVFFVEQNQEQVGFQKVDICLYIIKSCHNLTDYLKHIHGNLNGVQKVIDFTDDYNTIKLPGTETLYTNLVWQEKSWQETSSSSRTGNRYCRKAWAPERNTKFIDQPAGYKIATFQLSRQMNGVPLKRINLAVDIDVKYLNCQTRQAIFEYTDEINL